MAYVDSRFKLTGVFKTAENYTESEDSIYSYFVTTEGKPISLEIVNKNLERSPSKVRHKLKKKAPFYVFQRSRIQNKKKGE